MDLFNRREEQTIIRQAVKSLDGTEGDNMEPLFTNKCTYTKPNLIEVFKSTSSRKSSTIIFIFYGLIIFLSGLMFRNYIMCLLGVLFSIFLLFLPLWAVRSSATNRYQQLLQLYHGEAESLTSFYEDRLVVHYLHGGSDVTVAYQQIAKVFESKNLFFLMLSTRIGFMLEKKGFVGTEADEFGRFIRARAVGEGQTDLKKRKRKAALITTAVCGLFTAVLAIIFFGQAVKNIIPKTFTDGNYSIKLTSAFDGYEGEWDTPDVSVYCINETAGVLSGNGLVYETAEEYLQATNKSYGIDSVVTALSDTSAWTEYTSGTDEYEYYNYDYVIEMDGEFWLTEFYCLAENANKYKPDFEKWAQSIKISHP